MYQEIARNKRKTILLIGFFLIIISAIGYITGLYLDLGYGPLALAVIISIIMSLVSYFSGDKVALAMSGAKQIDAQQNPYVFHLVENLAITAGVPMPKVYLINDTAMNAFATGRDPQHASIAVTTGLVQALENEELEGVIAHELSHIKNLDIRVMTVAIICVGIIALLADWMMRGYFWGGNRRSSNDNKGAGGVLIIIGLVLAILAPIFAQLLQLAISRKREYLADASGSLLTRYPEGLARALEKISHSQPMRQVNRATAHLFISEPGLNGSGEKSTVKIGKLASLFSTHPPIAERVAKLRGM